MCLQEKEVSLCNFIFNGSEIIFRDHRLEFRLQLAGLIQLVIAPFLLRRWKLLYHGIHKRGRKVTGTGWDAWWDVLALRITTHEEGCTEEGGVVYDGLSGTRGDLKAI